MARHARLVVRAPPTVLTHAQVDAVLATEMGTGEFQLEFTDGTVYKLQTGKGARETNRWVTALESRIAWAAAEKAKRGDDGVEAWGTGRKGRGGARGSTAARGGSHVRAGSAGGRRRRGDDDDDDDDGDGGAAPAPGRGGAAAGIGRGGSAGRGGGFMSPAGRLDGVSDDEDATPSGRHGRGHGPRPSLMPRSGGRGDDDGADSDAEPPPPSRPGARAGAGAGGGSLAAAYTAATGGAAPAPAAKPAPKPAKPKAPPAPTRKGVVSQAAVTRLGKSQTWYMELRNGYLHLSK